MPEPKQERAHGLNCTREFVKHQRSWFESVQRRVADGEPLAIVGIDVPHEILVALDIPYVVAPWWSSVCAARGRSDPYLSLLAEHGYPRDELQYVSLGLASALDDEPGPWGGLPRPSIFLTHGNIGAEHKIMELWADAAGAELFALNRTTEPDPSRAWPGRIEGDWPRLLDGDALDLAEAEIERLVGWLEVRTGRALREEALTTVLRLVNQQARIFAESRDLLARARPCPADIADTIPATTIPQWHTGTTWACEAATQLLDELRERSLATNAPDDRVRLMWMGNPLWFDLGLYARLRATHGAATVWSMYLAIAADGYGRVDYGRPYRTLAARHIPHRDQLSMPPWNTSWLPREALSCGIDGAVQIVTNSSPRGHRFIRESLESAGIPVLDLEGDAVDPAVADRAAIEGTLSTFIENIINRQTPKRAKLSHI